MKEKVQFNWRLPVDDYKELESFCGKYCSPREKWEVGAAAVAAFNDLPEVERLRWLFTIRRRQLEAMESRALETAKPKK